MTPEVYQNIECRFVELLDSHESDVATDTMSSIQFYVTHAEIEMAVELFGLHVIETRMHLSDAEWNELASICVTLKLDEDSVYDVQFWSKLVACARESDVQWRGDGN